jgi:hypothetical protein
MIYYHISLFQRYGIFCIWIIVEASCAMVTGVTFVTMPRLQGGPEGSSMSPKGSQRSLGSALVGHWVRKEPGRIKEFAVRKKKEIKKEKTKVERIKKEVPGGPRGSQASYSATGGPRKGQGGQKKVS